MKNINTLGMYLKEIGRYDLLTADQEKELARAMRSEDADKAAEAREMLILSNLRLVVNIAKNYKNYALTFQDLISEGQLGLITAVERFNPELGYRFSTYAVPWIKQAILKALSTHSRAIRLPEHMVQLMRKYKLAIEKFVSQQVEITDEILANEIGTTVDKIQLLRQHKYGPASLDLPLSDEQDADSMVELVADKGLTTHEFMEKERLREAYEAIILTLPERTQKIINMRYGFGDYYGSEGHTLEEIGDEVGLSRERVRQILKESEGTIRKSLPDYGV